MCLPTVTSTTPCSAALRHCLPPTPIRVAIAGLFLACFLVPGERSAGVLVTPPQAQGKIAFQPYNTIQGGNPFVNRVHDGIGRPGGTTATSVDREPGRPADRQLRIIPGRTPTTTTYKTKQRFVLRARSGSHQRRWCWVTQPPVPVHADWTFPGRKRSLAACAPRAYDGRAGASQPRSGPQSRRPARRACRCRAAAPSPWACAREWPRTADCWGRGPARARHRPRTYRPCARFALRVRKPKWTCPGCTTSSIHPSARRRLRTVRVLRRFSACPRAPRHGSSAAGTVPEPAYVWSLLRALSLPPALCEFGAW